jgi:cysteine-rich repeat protein
MRIPLLLVLASLVLLGACSGATGQAKRELLHSVSLPGEDAPVAWVLGRVPVDDYRSAKLDRSIVEAFGASSSLAVELDPAAVLSEQLAQDQQSTQRDEDGSELGAQLGAGELARVRAWQELLGTPLEDLRHSRTSTVLDTMLGSLAPSAEDERTLAMQRYFIASSRGKRPLHELISFAEHQAAESPLSNDDELSLLNSLLTALEKGHSPERESLLRALTSGAPADLDEGEFQSLAEKAEQRCARINAPRNERMARRLDTLISSGERPFVVLEPAHLQGERSLLDELARLGYVIEAVTPSGELLAVEPLPDWATLPRTKVLDYALDWPRPPEWKTMAAAGSLVSWQTATSPRVQYFLAKQPVPAASLPAPPESVDLLDWFYDSQLTLSQEESIFAELQSHDAEVSSFPARRYQLSHPGGDYFGLLVWADGQLYSLVAVPVGGGTEDSEEIERVLSSFRLLSFDPDEAERQRQSALALLESEPDWLSPNGDCPLASLGPTQLATDSDLNPCEPDLLLCLDACREGDALSCLHAGESLRAHRLENDAVRALAARACALGVAEGCSMQALELLLSEDEEDRVCAAETAAAACALGDAAGCLASGLAAAQGRGVAQDHGIARSRLARVCHLDPKRNACVWARSMLLALDATRRAGVWVSASPANQVDDTESAAASEGQVASCGEPAEDAERCGACAQGCAPGIPCVDGVCGDVVQLVAGMGPNCARLASGEVLCWVTPVKRTPAYEPPVLVPGLQDAVELAAGGRQVCARRSDGTVWCWGDQHYGEYGASTFTTQLPERVEGIDDAVQVVVGSRHACVLHEDTSVSCWGDNHFGELGTGAVQDRVEEPQRLSWLRDVVELTAGSCHTCARVSSGAVLCWGWIVPAQPHRAEPELVPGLDDAVALSAGDLQTCARREDGSVLCWGGRKLAPSTTEARDIVLIPVALPQTSVAVSVGHERGCAILADRSLACWGSAAGEAAELDRTQSASTAVRIEGLADVLEVVLSYQRTCARLADGRILCWREDARELKLSETPVRVTELEDAVALQSGGSWSCARRAGGQTLCWGANTFGQLGDGSVVDSAVPIPLTLVEDVVELAPGFWHSCARSSVGTVACWGAPDSGIPGISTTSPVLLAELEDAVEVASGGSLTCVRRASGRVSCWGYPLAQQLEDGSMPQPTGPIEVEGIDHAVRLAVGASHACALLEGGTVKCWGENWGGQLGDGSFVRREKPAPVPGIDDAVELTAGYHHSCVLRAQGAVSCFGDGSYGQLGYGGWDSSPLPVDVLLTDVVEVKAGAAHTCARTRDGQVWCWGSNVDGQLGNEVRDLRHKPVRVAGVQDAKELAMGLSHTCARLASGQVECWGADESGQLGGGRAEASPRFTEIPGLSTRRCGDGALFSGESCDDGNDLAGDGCSESCAVEAGWRCTGEPSSCHHAVRGDDCLDPLSLSVPGSYSGALAGASNDSSGGANSCARSCSSGGELFFRVELSPMQLVEVTAKSADADLVLYAATGCEELQRSCIAGSDATPTGGVERLMLTNSSAERLALIVVVDSYVASSGSFTLELRAIPAAEERSQPLARSEEPVAAP